MNVAFLFMVSWVTIYTTMYAETSSVMAEHGQQALNCNTDCLTCLLGKYQLSKDFILSDRCYYQKCQLANSSSFIWSKLRFNILHITCFHIKKAIKCTTLITFNPFSISYLLCMRSLLANWKLDISVQNCFHIYVPKFEVIIIPKQFFFFQCVHNF